MESLTDNNDIIVSPEIEPQQVKLANGHLAESFTMMGEHTPGINSDYLWLNTDIIDLAQDIRPKILAVLNDGITGADTYRYMAPGQVAAQYFASEIPRQFDLAGFENSLVFSDAKLQPNFKVNRVTDAYSWLIQYLNKTDNSDYPLAHFILSNHGNLLVNNSASIKPDKIYGKNTAQIAKAILLEEEKFKAVYNLLVAIYNSIRSFESVFKTKFRPFNKMPEQHEKDTKEEKNAVKAIYAATTTGGVIDLPNYYMLFSIGDTASFVVDEFDIICDSFTSCQHEGDVTQGIGQGYMKIGVDATGAFSPAPRAGHYNRMKVNFVPKKNLAGQDFSLAILTDGLQQSKDWLGLTTHPLTLNIKDTRAAIRSIYERSLKWDESAKKIWPYYEPDDKSIVVIKKEKPKEKT